MSTVCIPASGYSLKFATRRGHLSDLLPLGSTGLSILVQLDFERHGSATTVPKSSSL
jgi:hypothetical protein